MRMRERKVRQQNFDAANLERKKQIAVDTSKLLSLAIAMKTEVDKSSTNTYSADALEKADEIEKLAQNVKAKMKLTVGWN